MNKTHRYDDISIRLLKICDSSIVRPPYFSRTVCRLGLFLITGKSQMFQLFMRKVIIIFCKTIGLFLCCQYVAKIFERIFFNLIFKCLEKNSLLCLNQSGFRPFDSCENQLLSIFQLINIQPLKQEITF